MKIKTEFTVALLLETDFQNYYDVKIKLKQYPAILCIMSAFAKYSTTVNYLQLIKFS